jgi:hypothetical protein
MLNRYETGPVATVLFIASALSQCGFGIFSALHSHYKDGWLNALSSLMLLFVFHKRFRRPKTS